MGKRGLMFFSYGMGVDSTAILLRWIHDPKSRDFPLEDLVVLSAMTGDEWPQTGRMVRSLVLPLMRAHHIRYIQVARAGPKQSDGVRVLDDSRSPTRLFIEGDYTLSDEMLAAGTVPQCGGSRKCSAKAKGWPLEQVIARLADGRPYRHVMGFELNEFKRADRDSRFNTELRTGRYPLIEWEWDRQACEDYVQEKLGVLWPKSACAYCPFALVTAEGRARTLERFRSDPEAGVSALFMEHVAVALNPRQGLIAGTRLYDILAERPEQERVLALLEEHLDKTRWAVYQIRRAYLPSERDPGKTGTSARQLRTVATGTRSAMRHALAAIAIGRGQAVDTSDPRHPRVWLQRRGEHLPAAEAFYVIAPHVVADKERSGFAAAWEKAITTPPASQVVLQVDAELHARLGLVLQLTDQTLAGAAAEALEDWIRTTLSDPDVLAKALARLDQEERLLQARRDTLQATSAGPAPDSRGQKPGLRNNVRP